MDKIAEVKQVVRHDNWKRMYEEYQKYPLMDQIMYFGRLRGVKDDELKKKIRYWSDRLKLDEYLYPAEVKDARGRVKKVKPKSPDQLSKGNQQKIQFLIAMLSDPELLVLDEPFSGLDPVNAQLLKDVVKEEIARGKELKKLAKKSNIEVSMS